MIPEYVRKNFETLKKGFDNGNACLFEVFDKRSGKPVYVICCHQHRDDVTDGKTEELVPFGKVFTFAGRDNPYKLYNPRMDEEDSSSKGTV